MLWHACAYHHTCLHAFASVSGGLCEPRVTLVFGSTYLINCVGVTRACGQISDHSLPDVPLAIMFFISSRHFPILRQGDTDSVALIQFYAYLASYKTAVCIILILDNNLASISYSLA